MPGEHVYAHELKRWLVCIFKTRRNNTRNQVARIEVHIQLKSHLTGNLHDQQIAIACSVYEAELQQRADDNDSIDD
jgi:hypothetical protein